MRLSPPRVLVLCLAAGTAALASAAQAIPAAAGGGGCRGIAFSDAPSDSVDLKDFCFQPSVVRVAKGKTVTFRNADSTDHTVSGVSLTFGSYDTLKPGASVTYRFDRDGVFPYFCFFHPGMSGALVVGTGQAHPGTPSLSEQITRVNPTSAKVATPPSPGGPPSILVGLGALALLLVGFAGGRWVVSR